MLIEKSTSKAADVATLMVARLDSLFCYPDNSNLSQCERLFATAIHLCEVVIPQFDLKLSAVDSLQFKVAYYLHDYLFELQRSTTLYQRVLLSNQALSNPLGLMATNQLALVYKKQDDYRTAKRLFLNALHRCNVIHGKYSEDSVRILQHLCNVFSDLGRFDRAKKLAELSIEIYLQQNYGENEHFAGLLTSHAAICRDIDEFNTAVAQYQQAIAILSPLYPDGLHPDIALAKRELAFIKNQLGDYAQAERLAKQAVNLYNQIFRYDQTESVIALMTLALVYQNTGHDDAVIEQCCLAHDMLARLNLLDSYDASTVYNLLGVAYQNIGEYTQAYNYLNKAIELRRALLDDEHTDLALVLQNLGVYHYQLEQWQQAIECFNQAYHIFDVNDYFGTDVAFLLDNIAAVYAVTGHLAEAIACCRKGIKILLDTIGSNNLDVVLSINNLAGFYLRLQLPARVKRLCRWSEQLLSRLEAAVGVKEWIGLYYNYAGAYGLDGNSKMQIHYLGLAVNVSKKYLGSDDMQTACLLTDLAQCCDIAGEIRQAQTSAMKALQIKQLYLPDTDEQIVSLQQLMERIKIHDK